MSENRPDLRAFGVNLALGMDGLFWGAALFTFVFRRASATTWRNAWEFVPESRAAFLIAVVSFVLLPVLYRGKAWRLSLLLGPLAAGCMAWCLPYSEQLVTETGSRAPNIAYIFFCAVFLGHALVLTVAGLASRGSALFRRFLTFQGAVALLILPVVFTW